MHAAEVSSAVEAYRVFASFAEAIKLYSCGGRVDRVIELKHGNCNSRSSD